MSHRCSASAPPWAPAGATRPARPSETGCSPPGRPRAWSSRSGSRWRSPRSTSPSPKPRWRRSSRSCAVSSAPTRPYGAGHPGRAAGRALRRAGAHLEARGGAVRTRARARVRFERGRVAGVVVGDARIDAPVVVAAVPWFALPALCADAPRRWRRCWPMPPPPAPRRSSRSTCADRPVMDDMLVGLPGRTFQWVFDKARVFGRARSHLSLVCSGAPPSSRGRTRR